MSDQTKSTPAKDPADAYAAAVSAQPTKPAAAKVQPPLAEPVKPEVKPTAKPVVAKAVPVAAPVTAPTAIAPVAIAKPAKPAPAVKPKTTKAKSAVIKSPVAAKAAAHMQTKETVTMNTAETITAETKNTAEAMTDRVKNLMGDMTSRAKTAFEKGSEMVSQANEFNKGNVEALVESTKIAAKGAQEMGQAYAEETKKGFEELTAALKEFTSVKSPTEFIELQSKLVRKSFDTAVAQTSKNSEAFLKLAGDVIQPISNRVSVAVDSFKKAA